MRILSSLATLTALCVAAVPAAADSMKYYPYHGKNFCPAGLQPISMGGVICCGTPNTQVTYRQMMRHPSPVHHTPASHDKGKVCVEGEKGC